MSTSSTVKVAASDVTPSHRQGGSTRALLTPISVGAVSGFMGTIELQPGEFISEHYHPYSDKFLYLISGEVCLVLNGEEIELNANEAVLITRGMRNRMENRGTETAHAVFHVSPLAPRPDLGHVDTEPVPAPDAGPPKVG